jgi:dipeptidyl aminopeptidase/acylaminoacyl peptidase
LLFKFDGNSDEPALFAAFSSDGKRLVTTYEDGTVRLWNGETGEAASVPLLEGHEEAVVSAVFSRDGNQIVTASGDGTARIWDLDSGNELARLEPGIERRSAVNSAVYSPDGRFVLTASKSGLATLWDGGKRIRDFRSDDSELFGAVFSPDGRRIVTASANRTARIWNAESGEVMVVLKGHTGACRTAIFSADGRQVLTAGDTTARLWSGTTGQLIKKLDNDFGILGAEFDHDGRSVLMMSQHKPFVYRWDVESGKAVGLSGTAVGSPNDGAHADRVARVAISADGRRIVTASNDGTARLWDGQTRAPIDVLEHSKAVSYAAISPDGRRVVTTSRDGTARLWHAFVSTQELIDFARRELPRCLAEPQRQKFGIEMPEWCRTLSKWPPPEDR